MVRLNPKRKTKLIKMPKGNIIKGGHFKSYNKITGLGIFQLNLFPEGTPYMSTSSGYVALNRDTNYAAKVNSGWVWVDLFIRPGRFKRQHKPNIEWLVNNGFSFQPNFAVSRGFKLHAGNFALDFLTYAFFDRAFMMESASFKKQTQLYENNVQMEIRLISGPEAKGSFYIYAASFSIPYEELPSEPKERNIQLRKDVLAGSQNLRDIIQDFLITVNYKPLPEGLKLDLYVKSEMGKKGVSAEQVYQDLTGRISEMLPAYQEFLSHLGRKTTRQNIRP